MLCNDAKNPRRVMPSFVSTSHSPYKYAAVALRCVKSVLVYSVKVKSTPLSYRIHDISVRREQEQVSREVTRGSYMWRVVTGVVARPLPLEGAPVQTAQRMHMRAGGCAPRS